MTKYYFIFGSICGILSVITDYFLFSGSIPYSNLGMVLFTKLLVLLLCIVFANILIKKLNGTISFLRTTFGGLMIALVCSSTYLAGYAYMAYPDYSFFKDAIEYSAEASQAQNDQLSDKLPKKARNMTLEDFKAEAKAKFEVKYIAKLIIFMYIAAGLIISVLLSAFISDSQTLQA